MQFYYYPVYYPVYFPVYYTVAEEQTEEPKRKKAKHWNPKADPLFFDQTPRKSWTVRNEVEFQAPEWMLNYKEPEISAFN
jgi:hypothetical protein